MPEETKLPPITSVNEASKKKKRPRCCALGCKKVISLIRFDCKCGLSFCTKHQLPEAHNCSYNHKQDGISSLKEKLIKVTANKIIPI